MSVLTRSCCLPTSLRSLHRLRRPQSLNFRLIHHATPQKTVVEQYLLDHIKATGPLPISTYMQQCLSHPTHGYYMNPENKVFGSRGDFITSPEISQVFGELIAIWCLGQYNSAGTDVPIRIIELGPGKGTLMADILRVFSRLIPDKTKPISVHLVETSPTMRATQKANIISGTNVQVHWHTSIGEILPRSTEYTMLVAHEFFDALPIHILQKTDTGAWHEVLVASNTEENGQAEVTSNETAGRPLSFRRVLAPRPSAVSHVLGHSSLRFKDLPVENSNAPIGGCGLIIDYGEDHAFGDSFRAFRNHKIVDIFHEPGLCDLTANVDFAYLKEAMSDLVSTHGPMPQGPFLNQLGLPLRLQGMLREARTSERRKEIQSAAERLVDPMGMGKEYQVLGIANKPERTDPSYLYAYPFPDSDPKEKPGT
ncbi:hypothetical protein M413DRAFT_164154 [Hebeloma cylindrosporum]|uniref:Protein arginine methyltransferase NDUFAF7 n=1 Tax=Hebeloma cylindrosporum TaxID=76867 RepID=A0A0C2XS79_HEBCY|nr:hypothetical protein M413DRAFT_164154 [Hebeloma cylindrosporum h7]